MGLNNSTSNTSGAASKLTAAALGGFITFHNTLKPRPNSSVPGNISLIPAVEIAIHAVVPNSTSSAKGSASSNSQQQKSRKARTSTSTPSSAFGAASLAVLEDFTAVLEAGGKLNVTCTADGITHQAVLERRERQLQRQKKAEKRRRREERERQERRVVREQEREAVRLERLAERKAKKLAERQARRRRAEASAGISPKSVGMKSSNSLTRLAEAESRSSKNNSGTITPRSGGSSPLPPGAGAGAERPSGSTKLSAARGGAPPLERQSSGGGGNSELMAAMARRRAKAQEE